MVAERNKERERERGICSWGRGLPVEKIFFYFWIVLKIASKDLLWLSHCGRDWRAVGRAETGCHMLPAAVACFFAIPRSFSSLFLSRFLLACNSRWATLISLVVLLLLLPTLSLTVSNLASAIFNRTHTYRFTYHTHTHIQYVYSPTDTLKRSPFYCCSFTGRWHVINSRLTWSNHIIFVLANLLFPLPSLPLPLALFYTFAVAFAVAALSKI